jgi:hypothetical protein
LSNSKEEVEKRRRVQRNKREKDAELGIDGINNKTLIRDSKFDNDS